MGLLDINYSRFVAFLWWHFIIRRRLNRVEWFYDGWGGLRSIYMSHGILFLALWLLVHFCLLYLLISNIYYFIILIWLIKFYYFFFLIIFFVYYKFIVRTAFLTFFLCLLFWFFIYLVNFISSFIMRATFSIF